MVALLWVMSEIFQPDSIRYDKIAIFLRRGSLYGYRNYQNYIGICGANKPF